jgi:hypothetical protein
MKVSMKTVIDWYSTATRVLVRPYSIFICTCWAAAE